MQITIPAASLGEKWVTIQALCLFGSDGVVEKNEYDANSINFYREAPVAPLPALPPALAVARDLIRGTNKADEMVVNGNVDYVSGPIIKVKQIVFSANSSLALDYFDTPFVILYADDWYFNGPFEIKRGSNFNLDGANGDPAPVTPPTPPGDGVNGNSGAPGFNGQDGQPGFALPKYVFIAKRSFFGDPHNAGMPIRRSNIVDVQDTKFTLDGVNGGNGGNGGRGGDGTDGNRGSPAQIGETWFGIDNCEAGPGWGGYGGNAGRGGVQGFGGNGGAGPRVYVFVSHEELPVFQSISVSVNGGDHGREGTPGVAGNVGHGGPEGYLVEGCDSAYRNGGDGRVLAPCGRNDIPRANGAPGTAIITDYSGFDELN